MIEQWRLMYYYVINNGIGFLSCIGVMKVVKPIYPLMIFEVINDATALPSATRRDIYFVGTSIRHSLDL